MIPPVLRNSKCHKAVRTVHASNYYELRERHPKVFGIRTGRSGVVGVVEETQLDDLPRVPVDGHELYSAGAGEVDQAYVGTCRREVSGLWSWHITTPGGKVVDDDFGYRAEFEAQEVMDARLDELNLLEGVA